MAAKLNWLQVRTIRHWKKEGWTHRELAKHFKVCAGTIEKIVQGKTWKEDL